MKNTQLLWLIGLFFLLPETNAKAQDIAAFVDSRSRDVFYIYENEQLHRQEFMPVPWFKVGGDYVIYENVKGEMMYYSGGESGIITTSPRFQELAITDHLFAANLNNQLMVIRPGYKKTISLAVSPFYTANDSLVAFIDYEGWIKLFEVQHPDKIREIDFLSGSAAENNLREFEYVVDENQVQLITQPQASRRNDRIKTSPNSMAFINYGNNLMFYQAGETHEVSSDYISYYQPANNFVAYLDDYANLKIFSPKKGIETLLADPPQLLAVGNNLVLFADEYDVVYLYENGKVRELLDYLPTKVKIIDDMIYFEDYKGFLTVYYKGELSVVEAFYPQRIQAFRGVLAYQDQYGYLKGFYEGKNFHVNDEIANSFNLYGRVIVFETGNNDYHIFHNGEKVY